MRNAGHTFVRSLTFFLIAALCFSVSFAQPTITSLTPLIASPGSSVTINGTNFNATAANNIVYFGATKGTVTAAGSTSLTVTVPTGATYMPVTVNNTASSLAAYSQYPFLPIYDNSPYVANVVNFASEVDFTSGSLPWIVSIGDLDGDGKSDIAVVNHGSNTVSIFRNISSAGTITSGSFASKVDFTTGAGPYSVGIGDLDGDGKLDLAVTNGGANTVSVFRNTSTPGSITSSSFASKVDFSTGALPGCVIIEDLDRDGKADLTVVNDNSNTLSILHNTSTTGSITNTSFAAKVDFSTASSPGFVAIGDIDGDGKPDLAVNSYSGNVVSVFRNTTSVGTITTGAFASKVDFASGTNPIGVALGDLDGDGKADLIVSSLNYLSVYRNTCSMGSITGSSFATKVDFSTGSFSGILGIGDIDGDHKPDLAVNGNDSVSVFRNTSSLGAITTASFAPKVSFSTGTEPYCVALGDLDGDSKPDIVVPNHGSGTISVLRNAPPSAITGTGAVCIGSTLTLSSAISGGTWSSSNSNATVNSSTGIVTGVNVGTVTITYTAAGSSATTVVTIDSTPNAGTITGASAGCAGSTITLSNAAAGGVWSDNNPAAATVDALGVVTCTATGVITISYTVTNACGTSVATKNISVEGISLVNTLAGNGLAGYTGNGGPGNVARLNNPYGLAIDKNGNTYIADAGNNVIRKVNPAGIISTYAGTGAGGFSGDGGPATAAHLSYPQAIAIDDSGNMFISDSYNRRIRKVNSAGVISTIAGIGGGYSGDGGPATAAGFDYPQGVAIDSAGNIYVAEYNAASIRKINTAGIISRFAGNGSWGYSGDGGPATAAELNHPWGIAIDKSGNLFVGDQYNNCIRRITPAGIISTYAGDGIAGYSGDGGMATSARLDAPAGVAVDKNGNVYACDVHNHCIRRVDSTGFIETLSGSGSAGFFGDGEPAVQALFHTPNDIEVDNNGSIYITDLENLRVRRINSGLSPSAILGVQNICLGTTASFSNALSGGAWSSSTPSIASVSSTGVVTAAAAGTAMISYAITNGCGTAVAIKIVTVVTSPNPGSITGPSSVTTGGTITLSDATAGGTWSASNSHATVSAVGVVTSITPGVVVISYSVTNSCGTAHATKTVSIGEGSIISPDTTICPGNSVRLVATANCFDYLPSGLTAPAYVGTGIWDYSHDTITLYSWSYTDPTTLAFGDDTTRRYGYIESTVRKTGSSAGNMVGVAMDIKLNQPGGYYLRLTDAGELQLHNGPNYLYDTLASVSVPWISLLAWNKLRLEVTFDGHVKGYLNDTARIMYDIPGGIPPAGCFGLSATNISYEFRNTTQYYAQGSFAWSTGDTLPVVTVSPSSSTTYHCNITTTCGSYTDSVHVFITPAPNPGTITGASSVSIGASITLSDSASGGVWSASNGNATVSPSGVVTGVTTGVVTISYTVTNSCGTSAVATKSVTINAAVTGTPLVCVGTTTTLTGTPGGGTWSTSNAPIAVVNAAGIVTGVSAGTARITYTFSGSHTITVVTVNTTPSTITGVLSICYGATSTLNSTPAGGIWSSTAPSVAGVSASGVISGLSTGNATISYTLANGCSRSAVATINNVPNAISGTTTVCTGGTTTLSNDVPGGIFSSSNSSIATTSLSGTVTGVAAGTALISYSIGGCRVTTPISVIAAPAITGTANACVGATTSLSNASPGGTWSSGNASIASVSPSGVVTGVGAGTAAISYSLVSGCTRTQIVTINAIPAIGGPSTVCIGGSANLTSSPATTSWTSSAASVATINSSGLITGVSAGTTAISVITAAGCTNGAVISVNPQPTITGTLSACVNSTTSLTGIAGGGTWTSSATGTASINASGVVTGVNAGTSTISYSLGTSCLRTAIVTINALPSISGTPAMCVNGTATLTGSPAGGTWSSLAPATAAVGTSGIVTGLTPGAADIVYTRATTGCTRTVIATVNPSPGAFSGITSFCINTTTTLSNAVMGGTWSSSTPAVATAAVATGVISGLSVGTSTITYRIGTCQATTSVNVLPLPNAITGSTQTIVGQTMTLNNATPGGTWSSSNPVTGTINATGVVTGLAAGTSNIVYTAPTGCTRSTIVTVNAMPPLPGPRNVCVGSSITISSPSVSVSSWISSDTSKAIVSGGVVTGVAAGTSTITYMLTAGGYGTTDVTVLALPATITGSLSVCEGASTSLSSATAGGTWLSSNAGLATVDINGVVSGVSAGPVAITYALGTGCRRTVTVTVSVKPQPITGDTNVCVGLTMYPYLASVSSGTWSSSDIAIATVPPTHGAVSGVAAGTVLISLTNAAGCSATREVVVSVCPPRGILSGTTFVNNLNNSNVNITVYPNPTKGSFSINAPETGTVSISTVDGREVMRRTVTAGNTELIMPYTTASGIYVCRFTGSGGATVTIRLVYDRN